MRRMVSLTVLGVSGILTVANYYIRWKPLNTIASSLLTWGMIIAAFSLGIGATNLLRIQIKNVTSRKSALSSLATIIAFFTMAGLGIASEQKGEAFMFLFKNMLQPLGDTVFSLLAFYIASASYRAFRAKSIETFILLGAALMMILGNTPFIGLISLKIPACASWIIKTPVAAGTRAIMVCSAIGGLAAALRAFVGLDTGVTG